MAANSYLDRTALHMGTALGLSGRSDVNGDALAPPSLRILALVADAFGSPGGIAEYDRHLLSSLGACQGVDEVIVLPRRGTSVVPLPSRVKQLPCAEGRLAYSLAVLGAARAHRPINVVFCGHLYMAPLAAGVAKLVRSHLWIQIHGLEAWHELPWLYRRSVEGADLITAVSRDTRRRLLEWADIDPARVKIVSNTVDPRFHPGPKSEELLARHGLRGKRVLMTVSRLSAKERYKGHDRVIRALPQVLVAHPDAIYLIVGDGDDRPRLEMLAAELGVAEKIRFVGHVSARELPDYFRLADILVMPSSAEGFGIVFLEALASGVDVIAGNKDGSMDALCDGALGIAVDPEDSEELVCAIRETLARPTRSADRPQRFRRELFAHHLNAVLSATFRSKRGIDDSLMSLAVGN